MNELKVTEVEGTHYRVIIFNYIEIQRSFFYNSTATLLYWFLGSRYRYYENNSGMHKIYIDLLASPNEIEWANFNSTTSNRYKRVALSWTLTLVIIGIGAWINKEVTEVMNKDSEQNNMIRTIYLCYSLIIILINQVIFFVLNYTTR